MEFFNLIKFFQKVSSTNYPNVDQTFKMTGKRGHLQKLYNAARQSFAPTTQKIAQKETLKSSKPLPP
jgi:hypothetical protein